MSEPGREQTSPGPTFATEPGVDSVTTRQSVSESERARRNTPEEEVVWRYVVACYGRTSSRQARAVIGRGDGERGMVNLEVCDPISLRKGPATTRGDLSSVSGGVTLETWVGGWLFTTLNE
ncbi:MAG: hypothetical protein OXF02_06965 [Simkaniaceae bacterium]|nr:hypothetical protein [Simkaniaceae bacterium]